MDNKLLIKVFCGIIKLLLIIKMLKKPINIKLVGLAIFILTLLILVILFLGLFSFSPPTPTDKSIVPKNNGGEMLIVDESFEKTQQENNFLPPFDDNRLSESSSFLEEIPIRDTNEVDEYTTSTYTNLINQETKSLFDVGGLKDLFGSYNVLLPTTQPAPKTFSSTESYLAAKKEVFKLLYPDVYTDGLYRVQDEFIEFGFLDSGYKKIDNFDSEDKIFAFVNIIIDVFENEGNYTKEEAEKYRTGVNVIWKNLLKDEEEIYLQAILAKSQLSKDMLSNRLFNLRQSSSKKILAIFVEMGSKFINKANAAFVISPDCYQDGAPVQPWGANVWAPCCDCGYICGSRGCFFVPHCYTARSGCNVQLGCLNLYGQNQALNAIWDSASGICGIG